MIKPVQWIDEVLEIALQNSPTPLSDEEFKALQQEAQKADTARINTH